MKSRRKEKIYVLVSAPSFRPCPVLGFLPRRSTAERVTATEIDGIASWSFNDAFTVQHRIWLLHLFLGTFVLTKGPRYLELLQWHRGRAPVPTLRNHSLLLLSLRITSYTSASLSPS